MIDVKHKAIPERVARRLLGACEIEDALQRRIAIDSAKQRGDVKPSFNERGWRIGQMHPRALYTDREVELVLELRDEGWGYKRIAKKMEMPRRTVRDICSARIRCQRQGGA
ncbi:hypothetical protein [Ottowia sp.]|uniref:hypothetical protein n=1 Tax=Ottowia sp. TaxID=1898956 RepID=UPI003A8AD5A7